MKKQFLFGFAAVSFFFASCGGGEATEENSSETDSTATEEEVVEPVTYTVDTAATSFTWWNLEGEEKDHTGSFKAADGSFTVEGTVITAASLTVDMNTLTEISGNEKLLGHIASADILNIAEYPTAAFTFTSHEDDLLKGTINAIGMDFPVEVMAAFMDGSVGLSDFSLDMSALPYFLSEKEEGTPAEEQHNPNIGFSGTVVGIQQ